MIDLPHTLSARVAEFVQSTGRYNLLSAGVGSGKTLALVYRALYLAMERPGSVGQISMATAPQMRDVLYPKIQSVLDNIDWPGSVPFYEWKTSGKSGNNIVFANGSIWRLRHLQREGRQRGTDLDYVCVDELTVDITQAVYQQLSAGRLRGNEQASFNATTNPGSKNHWAYNEWYVDPSPNHRLFTLRTTDNKHLPKSYLESLMHWPEKWRKQFMDGEWGVLEGAAFYLEPDWHTRADSPTGSPNYYLSFDWGFVDRFVCLLIEVADNHLHVIDEFWCTKKRREQILPSIQQMVRQHGVEIRGMTADTASPIDIRWFSNALSLPVYRPRKDRVEGWMKVLSLLETTIEERPQLTIHPRCKYLVESLPSLVWDDKKTDLAPGDDHAADALRYACMCGIVSVDGEYTMKPAIMPTVTQI